MSEPKTRLENEPKPAPKDTGLWDGHAEETWDDGLRYVINTPQSAEEIECPQI